ncbi:MAG: hypothetical protein ACJAS1_005091 [Oleiphilaceae bacterium]|jgi:hypothetical protein
MPITNPPELTLDGPYTRVSTLPETLLSGSVSDESGEVNVSVISDHFPATPLATEITVG